jgi:hypothetical protein
MKSRVQKRRAILSSVTKKSYANYSTSMDVIVILQTVRVIDGHYCETKFGFCSGPTTESVNGWAQDILTAVGVRIEPEVRRHDDATRHHFYRWGRVSDEQTRRRPLGEALHQQLAQPRGKIGVRVFAHHVRR